MEQNFKNHTRLLPGFHGVTYFIIIAALTGSTYLLYKAYLVSSGRVLAAVLVALSLAAALLAVYARYFALRAQDRAIRAEENFRYFMLTGKPMDSRLRLGQIIALRFASDAELPALSRRAVEEKLPSKEIKKAIQNWRGDYHRV